MFGSPNKVLCFQSMMVSFSQCEALSEGEVDDGVYYF